MELEACGRIVLALEGLGHAVRRPRRHAESRRDPFDGLVMEAVHRHVRETQRGGKARARRDADLVNGEARVPRLLPMAQVA